MQPFLCDDEEIIPQTTTQLALAVLDHTTGMTLEHSQLYKQPGILPTPQNLDDCAKELALAPNYLMTKESKAPTPCSQSTMRT